MASCVKPACTSASGDLDPNSDIEGIGFLIAFGLSAYLTLIICTISYLLNQDRLSNEIDKLIIKFVADRDFIKKFANLLSDFSKIQGGEKWNEALQAAVLNLSDQQIVTGLAILISGYTQLGCRGLAVYHWQLVVDLAFFSSVTHLTTLTCLRTYFRKRKSLRLTRLLCMGVVAIMLGCALWSTGYLGYGVELNFPAWCLYHREAMRNYWDQRGGTGFFSPAYTVLELLYLGFSYLTRILGLFPNVLKKLRAELSRGIVPGSLRKRVRDKATRRTSNGTRENTIFGTRGIEDREPHQSRISKTSQILWILLYRAILSVDYASQAISNLYGSVLWEITWLSIALAWGTVRVYEDRTHPSLDLGSTDLSSVLREVDTWAFSQVISIILLALPFLSFCEVAYDLRNKYIQPKDPPRADTFEQVTPPVSPQLSTIQTPASPASAFDHLTSGDAQGSRGREIYSCIWFHATVSLTYLLSVAVGVDIVHTFPYSRENDDPFIFVGDVLGYITWVCLDLFIIWVFVFVSLCMEDVEPDVPTSGWKPRWAAMSQRTYVIVLIVIVIIFLGVSVAYDVTLYYRPPAFEKSF